MTTYNPPHYRDENIWENIPETETERLQGTLSAHLRNMNVKKTKNERIQIVKDILMKQNNTCAFGKNVCGKWCWNESKVNFTKTKKEKDKEYESDKLKYYDELKYIKLQWGHIKPRCRNESQSINDLYLLCARCNNQIQTSRHLVQIKKELESKILHIEQFLQEKL
jgi:5-methylcytosine-specific restriction endonuclease McrA